MNLACTGQEFGQRTRETYSPREKGKAIEKRTILLISESEGLKHTAGAGKEMNKKEEKEGTVLPLM